MRKFLGGPFSLFQYYSHDFTALHQPLLTLYKTEGYSYSLMAYYDWISGIFSLVGGFLFWLISRYSKSYMHREHGFKRFYNHFLLFFAGLNVLFLAGNFETLYLGWEIIGISSFLLITFYRERYLPIKNGLKVISFYRLGDVALITAIWLFHHVNPHHLEFQLLNTASMQNLFTQHGTVVFLGSFFFVIAAGVS